MALNLILPLLLITSCGGGNGSAPVQSNTAPTITQPQFTVGGAIFDLNHSNVVGLDAGSLVLLNGNDRLEISPYYKTFVFPKTVSKGSPYNVTIGRQPVSSNQTCVVKNPSGTIESTNISNVEVLCTVRSVAPSKMVVSTFSEGAFTTGPSNIAIDSSNNLYVTDGVIRKITPTGIVSTFANPITNNGTVVVGIAIDATGNLFTANYNDNKIFKISTDGIVSTLAGSGQRGGANGNGVIASFNHPIDVAVDRLGNVYVADSQNRRIRKIGTDGQVTTLAGTGELGARDGDANVAQFAVPAGLTVDKNGNVYVADSGNCLIRKITPSGVVSTIAGFGSSSISVDGKGADSAFGSPQGIAVDKNGDLYVSDTYSAQIRKITPDGTVTTIAGDEAWGFNTPFGKPRSIYYPRGIALGSEGNIYVADINGRRVLKISPKL